MVGVLSTARPRSPPGQTEVTGAGVWGGIFPHDALGIAHAQNDFVCPYTTHTQSLVCPPHDDDSTSQLPAAN